VSTLGLYVPGRSPLHRTPAGVKLLGLVVAGVASVLLDEPWQVLVAVALAAAGYLLAGLSVRTAARQLRPVLWIAAVTAVFHV